MEPNKCIKPERFLEVNNEVINYDYQTPHYSLFYYLKKQVKTANFFLSEPDGSLS